MNHQIKRLLVIPALMGWCVSSEPHDPYSDLPTVHPYKIHGNFAHMVDFVSHLSGREIKTAVEIGSWFGLSSMIMGSRIAEGGKYFAIDPWDEDTVNYMQQIMPMYHRELYGQFVSNMIHLNLSNTVIPVKMKAEDAIEFVTTHPDFSRPDFIYVDGNHGTGGVLTDLRLWFPLLSEGGIMCGHDLDFESVRVAVIQFAREMNLIASAVTLDSWCLEHRDRGNELPKLSHTVDQQFMYPRSSDYVDLLGWFGCMTSIDNAFLNLGVKTVIDVNPGLGLSSSFMAARLPEGGKLFAVDTWAPEDHPYLTSRFSRYAREGLRSQFDRNMMALNISASIVPVQMPPVNAASTLSSAFHVSEVDFVYINAEPSTTSVYNELTVYYRALSPGGLICGCGVYTESLMNSVHHFAQQNGMSVLKMQFDSWCLQPQTPRVTPGSDEL